MPRLNFNDLPAEARAVVMRTTGPIYGARTADGGLDGAVAAVLETRSGRWFVKGIPLDHPQAAWQEREAEINLHLPQSSPRLYWRTQGAGWDFLVYEFIDGRHADYAPGSADLDLVLVALAELQELDAPESGCSLKAAEQRWAAYAPEGTANLFAGMTLLHTDWAPNSVLVTSHRAHVIDWAWPTAGAAWIDPFMLALRLVEAGHEPPEAVGLVQCIASWRQADPKAVEAFAVTVTRSWRELAADDPVGWKIEMAGHAARLETFLLVSPRPVRR